MPTESAAEEAAELRLLRGRALEPGEQARKQEERRGGRSADAGSAQAEQQKVALELARDVAVLGADEMQHLDDDAVAGHGAARGEDHAERGGGEDQAEDEGAEQRHDARHGGEPLQPLAVIVQAGARDLLAQALRQGSRGRHRPSPARR